jgi:photosystem II stability/assembly factor-like uncharacterized protein
MHTHFITTGESLLVFRSSVPDQIEQHLAGQSPDPIAVDPNDPSRVFVGTSGGGLWRSQDAGRSWERVGEGIPHPDIKAVAAGHKGGAQDSTVYAGTEPSTISRSVDGGETWQELPGLLELDSADEWSFPPKPETHHVRWIATDPHQAGRLWAAIEAGALVRSDDYGDTWSDRVSGGPFDTHTLATHPLAPGRLYSAAGDGYFASEDGADSWIRSMDGLRHHYLVSVAVDPADPDLVVVSASAGPYSAYWPDRAESFVYRKLASGPFELAMEGLPPAKGTAASRLATVVDEPGVFYAANNHGLFRSDDAGGSWHAMPADWPAGALEPGVSAVVII